MSRRPAGTRSVLASPPHHDTMLDARYDAVGVAVEDGRLYAVHVFADCLP